MVASFFISWWKLSNHFDASLILTYNSPEGLGGGCGSGGFLLLTKSENKVLLQAEKKVSLWSDVAIVKWRFLCEIIRIRSFRVLNTREEKKSEFTTSFCSLSLDKTGSMQREKFNISHSGNRLNFQSIFPVFFEHSIRICFGSAFVLAGLMERLRLLVQFNVTSALRWTRKLESLWLSSWFETISTHLSTSWNCFFPQLEHSSRKSWIYVIATRPVVVVWRVQSGHCQWNLVFSDRSNRFRCFFSRPCAWCSNHKSGFILCTTCLHAIFCWTKKTVHRHRRDCDTTQGAYMQQTDCSSRCGVNHV